mmetsp:Transcript_13633/g.19496  ORF Transcript_13633/g.19496 Transcript_13633/m.19496 type:complete len:492 (+) Transcript_13633:195-1670(+)
MVVSSLENSRAKDDSRAKETISNTALFLGEHRDGVTMLNMQNVFLVTSKGYTKKQAGMMFFAFGMSQFLFQAPAGYLMDYSQNKVLLLGASVVVTSLLTLATAAFAAENGGNLGLMIFVKVLQGIATALIPPGLNSITQGIVGTEGMTAQVSQNEMMHHLGTAIIVLTASLLAFVIYPNVGFLFIVSPIACIGVIYYLKLIDAEDIDHREARGLPPKKHVPKVVSFDVAHTPQSVEDSIIRKPSFNFGFGTSFSHDGTESCSSRANTPLQILKDPQLMVFLLICFSFQLANGTVLPLVMQTLAVGNGRTGILMSGLCIAIAQVFMECSAEVCGKYSAKYGRKPLYVFGILSLPLRCLILTILLTVIENAYYPFSDYIDEVVILFTQILDGIGAGVFGTMYVLVSSDISGGTGRFSLTLGLTTAAITLGGTVSGYFGQALAMDIGYKETFGILGYISCIPSFLYICFMPETLPGMDKSISEISENGLDYQQI